ncbi:segregation and condensation protein A [Schaalia suimastitidis]|uniref:segregation and condensation protein A n=1 Tax=Schaalia suimastitidis TaxID=121163 RepID=UPI00047A53BF|nr:ScpA family protein [Schaalia suimastitidis]
MPPKPEDPNTGTQGRIDQFHVALEVFEGPFDLLLQLIARKRLDITQVALAEVTDEFIAHMQHFPDLSATTEFLVVAATLLDMKAASLLPRIEDTDDTSAQDLEARDLLFSRLLQYRAFRLAGQSIGVALDATATRYPRNIGIEEPFTSLLPELVWTINAHDLARAAADALSQRPPTVQVTHLHDPVVPVAPQLHILVERLRSKGSATFAQLVADAENTAVIVSRFLATLELYRSGAIEFTQDEALGRLTLIWTGQAPPDEGTVE